MKKFVRSSSMVAMAASAIFMCSCSKNFDFSLQQETVTDEYAKGWENAFGDIDSNQDWNLATQVTMKNPMASSNASSILVYDAMPGLLYGAPGHATGMDYVPYNNYLARLHEGEAVLTKAEASLWRRGDDAGGAVGIDYGQLGQAVAAAMAGMSVQMDGQAVGVLVTGAVSREMGRRVKARQYTG